jgi:hypothetical protein
MLRTKERPCSHRSCWEPENGHAHSTRAGTREPADLLWRTRPDTPNDGPDRGKSGSPGVPSRARSAFCDRPELRHRQTRELIYKIPVLLAALASFASRIYNWCLLDRSQFYGLVDLASFVWRISNWCLQDRLDFCGDRMQTWICNVLCASNICYKVVFLSYTRMDVM